jgi:hypothetical protein
MLTTFRRTAACDERGEVLRPLILLIGAAAVGLLGTLMVLSPAHARLSYQSCQALHQRFPHGVARSVEAAEQQVRDGFARPAHGRHARDVYVANHRLLDTDRDGTACEG